MPDPGNSPFVTNFFVLEAVLVVVHAYRSARLEPYVSAKKIPASEPPLLCGRATIKAAPTTVGMTAIKIGSMRRERRSESQQTVTVVMAATRPRGIESSRVCREVKPKLLIWRRGRAQRERTGRGCEETHEHRAVARQASVRNRGQKREEDEQPCLRVEHGLLCMFRLELVLLRPAVVVADLLERDDLFAGGEELGRRG